MTAQNPNLPHVRVAGTPQPRRQRASYEVENRQPSLFGENLVSYRTASGKVVEVIKRGKHYVEPRGYADKPGTGPKGETCRSCKHRTNKGTGSRSFPACALTSACWSATRRTDILVGAAACSKWERKT